MARTRSRPPATQRVLLKPRTRRCPSCRRTMWADYDNHRTVTGLQGIIRYRIRVRRCVNAQCERFHKPFRPEAEGGIALPGHEFGLDVIAQIGILRYVEHRSVPEIHQILTRRGLFVCERTVTNLLDRYDELRALSVLDVDRLRRIAEREGRAILAIDGLQPDVGHEVLWVIRDCLSGEVLLTRSLLSGRGKDLAELLREVKEALGVPVEGVVSDGQQSIRKAVAKALPDVPHQLCHFHYLREAAKPIYEADRHAKKELKKLIRGVRPLERAVEGLQGSEAEAVRAYCQAVRSALTDDARPPLRAAGLKLQERITQIVESLKRVEKKGGPSQACSA